MTLVRLGFVFLITLVASSARAQVTVTLQPGPSADYAASLGIDVGELESQLQADIEEVYQALRPNAYLRAFANAQTFSAKGLGVDYASNPTVLSCGLAGNVSAGIDEDLDDDVAVAPGVNMALMCGLNLGRFRSDLRDLTIYGSLFRFKSEAFVKTFTGTLTTLSAHAQYKLFRPANRKRELIVQWGGFDLTTGLEFTRLTVGFDSDGLFEELPVIGQEVAGAVRESVVGLDSRGLFSLSSNALTIPIEASTNLRVAYVLTFFGGLGFDLQVGNSDLDVELSGNMSAENPMNPAETVDLGTADIQVHGESSPSKAAMRLFAGVQANLWRARLFLQANVRPDPAAVGLTFGGRVAW